MWPKSGVFLLYTASFSVNSQTMFVIFLFFRSTGELGQFEDVQKPKPDLVDFDNDVDVVDMDDRSSNQSDDFILVSKVFDLNTPLDQSDIIEHLQCQDCRLRSCQGHPTGRYKLTNLSFKKGIS